MKIVIPTNEAYIWAIRKLHEEGKITLEQYGECLRRYSEIKTKNYQWRIVK